tara:strand:+ start:18634 stop:18996 length:363 start_codon:yes stop_codon:yes gene_type:complete
MKTIRLELARNADNPEGNPGDAYDLHAALTAGGKIDFAAGDAQLMTFTRYLPHRPAAHGQLVKTDSGAWAFSYEAGDDDDEVIVGLENHDLSVGGYLTVVQHDRDEHVYRVVAVSDRIIA